MSSPFLDRPGAVAVESGPDVGVAAHYGQPLPEQRALAAGEAIVDLGHLGVVEVRGADRLTLINSLTSQLVVNLADGVSADNLLLSVQGRIEHEFGMLDDGASAWLVTEAGAAADLAAWFTKMRFMMRVEVLDRSDDIFPVATLGEHDLGSKLVWRDPWSQGAVGGVTYAATPSHPGAAYTLSLHLLDADQRAAAAEFEHVAGVDALEALRIAAWRPREAREFDDRVLPHELDLLRSAVHLNKGCYRGQETIAKVHNLGHPPRRLVQLDLDGALAQQGALVYVPGSDKPVGRVTSSANHYEDGPIALALLKRGTDAETQLEVADVEDARIAAAQTVIVPPGAGSSVDLSAFRGR